MSSSTCIIIPARLKSTRLPRKILLDLGGKPVVQRVYEQCVKAINKEDTFIAVDANETYLRCKEFTDNVIMTSEMHQSGTDRIAEASKNLNYENVINVQGDEPFIEIDLLIKLINKIKEKDCEMVSAATPFTDHDEASNKDSVKVVLDNKSNALYFSRSVIPFQRNKSLSNIIYKHIGVYGYKKSIIERLVDFKSPMIETAESLEQLRALYYGVSLAMIKTERSYPGIDNLEDYKKAKEIIKSTNDGY